MRVRLQHLAGNPAFFSFFTSASASASFPHSYLSSLSLLFVGLLEEIGVGLSDLVYLLMVLMGLVVMSCEFEPFEVVVSCENGGEFKPLR